MAAFTSSLAPFALPSATPITHKCIRGSSCSAQHDTRFRLLRKANNPQFIAHGKRMKHVSSTVSCLLPSMSTGNKRSVPPWPDESKKIHELTLSRRDLDQGGKRRRPVRLSRRCTLQELDVETPVHCSKPVDVSIVSQSINLDYRLMGAVAATVPRECDRCLKTYEYQAKGTFELWLSSTGVENIKGLSKKEMDELEAIEDFSGPEATVNLVPHIRDGVILSLPSRSLCDDECAGISIRDSSSGSVVYGGRADSFVAGRSVSDLMSQLSDSTSEQLRGLKEALEE